MDDLWLFVEHGQNRTWTRAQVPASITTTRDLVGYLARGGGVDSEWMEIPPRARFLPRVIGRSMTVIAALKEDG